MTATKRRSPRVTIKIHRHTFDTLSTIRKRTGVPITTTIHKAVEAYASFLPRRKPGRPRKLRGSK